jgi:hypothetical protein
MKGTKFEYSVKKEQHKCMFYVHFIPLLTDP